ncbi:hypothetical protein NS220_06195 [Microbacterium testaceum]|uniref:Uncharacterized protein n=1 Tax=Microbacterium testaceum TaxID=2033 RepID=A0A147EYK5_MICTE|nr:hypothetical protein NS220_06195 [Microbacterium testaceum]
MVVAGAWAVPILAAATALPAHAASDSVVEATTADRSLQRSGTTVLEVKVTDADGTPRSGRAVSISFDSPGLTASPDTGATDAQGVFTSTLTVATDASPGRRVVSATTSDGVATAVVSVAGSLMLTVSPSRVLVGGSASVVVSTVDDEGGPVAGVGVSLESSGAVDVVDHDVTTGADGRASTTIVWGDDAQPGMTTLIASVADGSWGQSRTVLEALAPLEVVLSPMLLSPGETGRLSVLTRDASTAPTGGIPVSLSVTGSEVTLSSSSVTTNGRGTAVVDVVVAPGAARGARTITAATSDTTASTEVRVTDPPSSTELSGFRAPRAVAAAGARAFVVDGDSLASLDSSDGTVTARMALGQGIEGRALTLDGTTVAYVGDVAGRVVVCDLSQNAVRAVVSDPAVSSPIAQVSLHSSGRRVFAASPEANAVVMIDPRTDTLVRTLSATRPVGVASGAGSLSFFFYVVEADGTLRYFDERDDRAYSVVDLGVGAGGPMVVSSDGETGWIAATSGSSSWLVTVALRQATVTQAVRLAASARGIARSADDAYVYVATAAASSSITAFATDVAKVAGTFDAGAAALSVAATPDGTRLLVPTEQPGVTLIETGLAASSSSGGE